MGVDHAAADPMNKEEMASESFMLLLTLDEF
jgi:hypothetical protein